MWRFWSWLAGFIMGTRGRASAIEPQDFSAKEIKLGVIINRMLATAVERRVGGDLNRCPKV
jgi:hypothetical protein